MGLLMTITSAFLTNSITQMPIYDHYLMHKFGRCVVILLMTSTSLAAQHSSTAKYACYVCCHQ